ncbi:MAG: hypothetical protein ACK4WK_07535, partial [Anaerolineae bacterium]
MSVNAFPDDQQLPGSSRPWPAAAEVDIESMLAAIQTIEQSLRTLKEALEHLREVRKADTKPFSLYGIFPSTDITWEDFQQA